MASIFFRGISRTCLHAGKNGVCQSSKLTPQLSRAFAVAPFRAAVTHHNNSQDISSTQSTKLLNNKTQKLAPSRGCATASHDDGDHVKLWTAERVLSVVLLGAIPAAIAVPSPAVETFLALSLTLHSHWGIEALVHDYIRPSMFGAVIPRLSVALVYGLSMMTFGGLCYFIYTDVGLINAVSMFWKL